MFDIRHGEISEIEKFQLFDGDNQGDDVVVALKDGEVVAYMQIDEGANDAVIFFMESEVKGAGSALVDWLKSRCDYIVSNNVIATAEGFYAKHGFTRMAGKSFYSGQFNMEWAND